MTKANKELASRIYTETYDLISMSMFELQNEIDGLREELKDNGFNLETASKLASAQAVMTQGRISLNNLITSWNQLFPNEVK